MFFLDIASGGVDSNVVVFHRPSGQIISIVTSVKFAVEGELVVSGSANKTVRVWLSSENGNYDCRHVLKDHTAEVAYASESTAFHPDSLILGTGTSGSLVKIWDVKSQVNLPLKVARLLMSFLFTSSAQTLNAPVGEASIRPTYGKHEKSQVNEF